MARRRRLNLCKSIETSGRKPIRAIGQWTMDNDQWSMDNDQWSMVNDQ